MYSLNVTKHPTTDSQQVITVIVVSKLNLLKRALLFLFIFFVSLTY